MVAAPLSWARGGHGPGAPQSTVALTCGARPNQTTKKDNQGASTKLQRQREAADAAATANRTRHLATQPKHPQRTDHDRKANLT